MNEHIRHLTSRQVDFRFRMKAHTNTSEGILLDYIRNGCHPFFSAREMVVRALKAYWLPFAYRDHQEVLMIATMQKQLAREAISSLKQQIRDLEQSFELVAETSVTYPVAASAIPLVLHCEQQSFDNLVPGSIEQVSQNGFQEPSNKALDNNSYQWINDNSLD